MDFELTAEEKAFIRRLKKATKNIPPRLWLFAAESGLHVMRRDENGERSFTDFDGVDQELVVDLITMDCGSGAW